jgi:hypothetical protein
MLLSAIINQDRDVAWRELDEEALLLAPNGRAIHNLNATGTFIWNLIDGQKTIGDIIQAACEEFSIEYEQAQREIIEFINELKEKSLVVIQGG